MNCGLRFTQMSEIFNNQKMERKRKRNSKLRNDAILVNNVSKQSMKLNGTEKCKTEERNKAKMKKKKAMTIEEKRRIANERERTRVHAISTAFDDLRKVIPCYSNEQRLSKLSILRVAINYIAALEMLDKNIERYTDVVRFKQHVDDCTITLQSEYGKAKKRKNDTE